MFSSTSGCVTGEQVYPAGVDAHVRVCLLCNGNPAGSPRVCLSSQTSEKPLKRESLTNVPRSVHQTHPDWTEFSSGSHTQTGVFHLQFSVKTGSLASLFARGYAGNSMTLRVQEGQSLLVQVLGSHTAHLCFTHTRPLFTNSQNRKKSIKQRSEVMRAEVKQERGNQSSQTHVHLAGFITSV